MRKFEKISFNEFRKNNLGNEEEYNSYCVPRRHSAHSAGYDFELINDIVLKPKEVIKIATGIKVCMNYNDILLLIVRSSTGFKYNVRLTNQVGVLDSDYYNNPDNEGHIFLSVQNESDKEIVFEKKSRIVQGIFVNYLVTDDDFTTEKRMGGLGSTGKGDKK
ncbi:MAG: deoxyuridine 5'-triphosphate nucleotidohydrolase [Bacilli bacterium]